MAGESSISTLLVGELPRQHAQAAIGAFCQLGPIRTARDVDGAANDFADTTNEPHLIVLAASYPGQFQNADVDRLRRLAPLARIISVLGSWCEGEPRSGTPMSAVPRIYWHQFAARLRTARLALNAGHAPFWSAPMTTTTVEAVEHEATICLPKPDRLVVIQTSDQNAGDCLSDICQSIAASAVVVRSGDRSPKISGVGMGLFDSRHFEPAEHRELSRFVARIAPAPVFVLANFPRHQDVRRALACGARDVLSKPFLVTDLLTLISQWPDVATGNPTSHVGAA